MHTPPHENATHLRLLSENLDEAKTAAAHLAEALNTINILLPSLHPQVPAMYRTPGMVDLGGVRADVAHTLAHWIETHHNTPEDTPTPENREPPTDT